MEAPPSSTLQPVLELEDPSVAAAATGSLDGVVAPALDAARQQQSPVPPVVGTLSAAQTQYLNQLTQQTSEKGQYGVAAASQVILHFHAFFAQ